MCASEMRAVQGHTPLAAWEQHPPVPSPSISFPFTHTYTHTHTHTGVWILSDYAWHTKIERLKLHAR